MSRRRMHCERSLEAALSSFRTLVAVGRSYWSNQTSRRGVTDCTSSVGSNSHPGRGLTGRLLRSPARSGP
jgi:hypothetical protein